MNKSIRLFGHPIHPMLVHFPLGLFPVAMVFDLIYLSSGELRWGDVSFWMLSAGIVGGLLAAVFGLLDFLAIPRATRAFRIGLAHGLGNLVVVTLFALSWLVRYANPGTVPGTAIALAGLGILLALVAAWLGGELVTRHGVGVDPDAHVNASSSLGGSADRMPSPPLGHRALER